MGPIARSVRGVVISLTVGVLILLVLHTIEKGLLPSRNLSGPGLVDATIIVPAGAGLLHAASSFVAGFVAASLSIWLTRHRRVASLIVLLVMTVAAYQTTRHSLSVSAGPYPYEVYLILIAPLIGMLMGFLIFAAHQNLSAVQKTEAANNQ